MKITQLVEEGLFYYTKKLLELCNLHTFLHFFNYLFFVADLEGKRQEGTWRKLMFSFSPIISDFHPNCLKLLAKVYS